jgi:hypothetical protein
LVSYIFGERIWSISKQQNSCTLTTF